MTAGSPPLPLFDRDGWWQPSCRAFASLRSVSAFRLALLHEWLGGDWRGRTVVDLGCGGGLLAIPLARAGARVVGVDVAAHALRAARREHDRGWLAVVGDLAATPLAAASADVVLLADVIEHLASPAAAVLEGARLLRPGGSLFVNTIARTRRSRWLAIGLAEALGFVPRGTHAWAQFVNPDELCAMAAAARLHEVAAAGEAPRVFATLRRREIVLRRSRSKALGYAMLFRKSDA